LRKILFSAVKNEGPFILEWVAYHKIIGFDDIVIISNDCDDGTQEILDVLHDEKIITHIKQNVPDGTSPQDNAALIATRNEIPKNGDWCIWLDADEFLNIHVGNGKLPDLIKSIEPHAGILLNWKIFCDGGNDIHPGRHISNSFIQCRDEPDEFNMHYAVKTLFKKDDRIEGFAEESMHRPKIKKGSTISENDFLSGNGNKIIQGKANTKWLQGKQKKIICFCEPEEHGFKLAQINHYIVRTPEMFALKSLRGRGTSAKNESKNKRHTSSFFASLNRPTSIDTSILKFEHDVDDLLQSMINIPSIRKAQENINIIKNRNLDIALNSNIYHSIINKTRG